MEGYSKLSPLVSLSIPILIKVRGNEIKKEIDIQNLIRVELSKHARVFRGNVGKVRMADGRYFDTGLPKGFSDLFGFRKSDGKMFFIEVKNAKGRLRPDQEKFLKFISNYPVLSGVARSPEEALEIINRD